MADFDSRPPEPVGPGGGQGGGSMYMRKQPRKDGGESEGGDTNERGPGLSMISVDGDVDLAPGLDEGLPAKAEALIERLAAQVDTLGGERDALKAEANRLRVHAEQAEHLGVATEYGIRIALGRVLSNRRHLSGVPGMVVVSVTGLEAVGAKCGHGGWRRAMRTVLDKVRDAAHATDTIGVLASGEIAVVTLVGDHAALERLGAAIVAGVRQIAFHEGTDTWQFGATFGGAELHDGAGVDAAFETAERARIVADGVGDPVAVATAGDTTEAVEAASKPSVGLAGPGGSGTASLSEEDLDQLAILGTVGPGRMPNLTPSSEPRPKQTGPATTMPTAPTIPILPTSGDDIGE